MTGRLKIGGGLALLVVLAVLGLAAKTSALTRLDLRMDEHLVPLRTPDLTIVAKAATFAAQSAVGVAVALLAPVVLWLVRRRRDALLSGALMIGALGIAFVVKTLVAEHRPPRGLWVIPPDNAMSFPSGHATVAAAVALILVMVVRGRPRWAAVAFGAAFAVVVAAARVYLGVHYPLDVLGGYLAAASSALLVAGVLDLPIVRRSLEDVGTPAAGRHHAGRTSETAPAPHTETRR